MQCCGVDGPLDYRRLSLPWSCCSRPEHAYESACDTHYKRGCLAVLTEQIKIRLLLACFAAAGIALAQVSWFYFLLNLYIFFVLRFDFVSSIKTFFTPISLNII